MQPVKPDTITVEVAYALPHVQSLITLQVAQGTTALQAIWQSGILEKHQEISLATITLGIFGTKVSADRLLQAMDRVEIYRPLRANPKEARRQRIAAKNGKLKTKQLK